MKKRALALLLSFILVLGLVSPGGFALASDIEEPIAQEQTVSEEAEQTPAPTPSSIPAPAPTAETVAETPTEDKTETGEEVETEEPANQTTEDAPPPEAPQCNCGAEDGQHKDDCPCFAAPEEEKSEDGEKTEEPKKDDGSVIAELSTVIDGLSISAAGKMPAGARLEAAAISEEELAFAKGELGAFEGENGFILGYGIRIIVGEGDSLVSYTPQELGLKLTIYFVEKGLCFAADTAAYTLTAVPVEKDEGEIATEYKLQALEGMINGESYIMFSAQDCDTYILCGSTFLMPDAPKELTVSDGSVSVTGVLPEGTSLAVTPMADPFAPKMRMFAAKKAAPAAETGADKLTYTYDVKLSLDGQQIQPDGTVRVSFKDVAVFENGYIEVMHILDSPEAILAGKGLPIGDGEFVAAFPNEAAIAEQATGQSGVVYVESFSLADGTVDFDDEGYVCVYASSFSTFYILSGNSANGRTDQSITLINDGTDENHYYVAPGTHLTLRRENWGNAWWGADRNNTHGVNFSADGNSVSTNAYFNWLGVGVDWTRGDYLQVDIAANATTEQTYKIETWRGATQASLNNKQTLYFHVISQDAVVDSTISNTNYPVYLAVLRDSSTGIPGEPCVAYKSYYFSSAGIGSLDPSSETKYATIAEGVIDSNISSNSFFERSQDGTNTMGVVDASGAKTKAVVYGINWNTFLDRIAAKGDVRADDGQVITNTNKGSYEVRPYVVKLQTSFSLGWHIDCYVTRRDNIQVSYNANIPAGLTVANINVPETASGTPPLSVSIGNIRQGTDQNAVVIPVGGTVTATDGTNNYTLTFRGWYTRADGDGNPHNPNSTASFNVNTVLYGKWDSNIRTGSIEISKQVLDAAGSQQHPGDDSFTFTVNFQASNNAKYTVYDSSGHAQGTANRPISSGGTISLTDGQWARITGVANGAYSVTEANKQYYTQSSTGASGTVAGGAISRADFTNTYNKLIQYQITYVDPMNGTPAPESPVSYTSADTLTIAAAVSKDGYKFGGWKVTTAAGDWTLDTLYSGGNNIGSGHSGNVTLTAQWTPQYKYKLLFNSNVPAGSAAPASNIPANRIIDTWQDNSPYNFTWIDVPTRPGYEFLGWAESANGPVLTGGAALKTYSIPGVAAQTAERTLYAQWGEAISYTITYDPNGGALPTGQSATVNYTVESSGNLSAAATRAGYTFGGWKLETAVNNWEAKTYEASEGYGPSKYGNVTLVAQWDEETVKYTYTPVCDDAESGFGAVKLNDAGAVANETGVEETVGKASGGPNPAPGAIAVAAEDFRFVGWFDNENCTGTPISTAAEFNPPKSGDPALYQGGNFYAKFEYDLAELTISKAGAAYDAGDSFIFDLYEGQTHLATFTMKMGESVTVGGLRVGHSYTVSERTQGTRYNGVANQSATLTAGENQLTFTNSVGKNKWLSSSESLTNVFGSGSTN